MHQDAAAITATRNTYTTTTYSDIFQLLNNYEARLVNSFLESAEQKNGSKECK